MTNVTPGPSHLHGWVCGGRVLEYEGVEFVVEFELSVVSARFAPLRYSVAFRGNYQVRLRVVALRTQHELADEAGVIQIIYLPKYWTRKTNICYRN